MSNLHILKRGMLSYEIWRKYWLFGNEASTCYVLRVVVIESLTFDFCTFGLGLNNRFENLIIRISKNTIKCQLDFLVEIRRRLNPIFRIGKLFEITDSMDESERYETFQGSFCGENSISY